MNKNSNCIKVLEIIIILSTLVVLFLSISTLTTGLMNSDWAFLSILAHEQRNSHSILPVGMNYSTGVFLLGVQNIIVLLSGFIHNWMTCRIVSVILTVVLLLAIMGACYKKSLFANNKSLFWGIIFSLWFTPFSYDLYDLYYLSAQYLFSLMFLMFGACCFLIMKNQKSVIATCLLFLVISLMSFSLFNVVAYVFPILSAILIATFIERRRLTDNEKRILGITLVALIIGQGVYMVSEKISGWSNPAGGFQMVEACDIPNNLGIYVASILTVYGYERPETIFSVTTIVLAIKLVFGGVTLISIIGVCKRYASLCIEKKYLFLYSLTGSILLSILFVLTSASGATYHLLPVYILNSFIVAIYVDEINDFVERRICLVLISCLIGLSLVDISFYSSTKIDSYSKRDNNEAIVDSLKSHGVKYAMGTFWNTNIFYVLSNGEIKMLAFEGQNPESKNEWLNRDSWYEMFSTDDSMAIVLDSNEQLEKGYYNLAKSIEYVGGKTILYYDSYPKFEGQKDMFFSSQELFCGNNAYVFDNNIVIKQGGIQYGPYTDLECREYNVVVYGNGLSNAIVVCSGKQGEITLEYTEIQREDGQIQLLLNVPEDLSGIEVSVQNVNAEEIIVSGIAIKGE